MILKIFCCFLLPFRWPLCEGPRGWGGCLIFLQSRGQSRHISLRIYYYHTWSDRKLKLFMSIFFLRYHPCWTMQVLEHCCWKCGSSLFDLLYWFKGFYQDMTQISKVGCKKGRSNIKKDWTALTTMFNGTKDFRYHGL